MWVKIDDGFTTHPKVLAAGPIPALIQIRAICYASQHMTDGFIPISAVPLFLCGLEELGIDIGGVKDMVGFGCQANEIDWPPKMVETGLWEVRTGGFYIHDYLKWNVSKSEYESFTNKKRKAGKKGMKARWAKGLPGITGVITPVIQDAITKRYHPISTITSVIDPLSSLDSLPPQSINTSDLKSKNHSFEEFWKAYPKKLGGKKNVLKAWDKARKEKEFPAIDVLLAAITAAQRSPQWTKDNGDFIPYPATWLNQGRWSDEPTAKPRTTMDNFLARRQQERA